MSDEKIFKPEEATKLTKVEANVKPDLPVPGMLAIAMTEDWLRNTVEAGLHSIYPDFVRIVGIDNAMLNGQSSPMIFLEFDPSKSNGGYSMFEANPNCKDKAALFNSSNIMSREATMNILGIGRNPLAPTVNNEIPFRLSRFGTYNLPTLLDGRWYQINDIQAATAQLADTDKVIPEHLLAQHEILKVMPRNVIGAFGAPSTVVTVQVMVSLMKVLDITTSIPQEYLTFGKEPLPIESFGASIQFLPETADGKTTFILQLHVPSAAAAIARSMAANKVVGTRIESHIPYVVSARTDIAQFQRPQAPVQPMAPAPIAL